MRSILLFVFLLFATTTFTQQQQYVSLVSEAEQLYKSAQYLSSARKYAAAFSLSKAKATPSDRYNAACSYSLAGLKDSAFFHLFKIAKEANYDNYNHLTIDKDLAPLYSDKRWKELTTLVKHNKEKAEANLDKPLVDILDTIYKEDQAIRIQLSELMQKYKWESPEIQALVSKMAIADSINLLKVTRILDQRGWLGKDVVGRQGNQTLFLVIQHAELAVQLKYYPMMKEAVKQGKANPANFALLEDRIAIGQGKRQTYGSQVGLDNETGTYYVQPLDDPDNVDKRRATVGLGKLSDYLAEWNIKWDAAEYKRQLPLIEAKLKK